MKALITGASSGIGRDMARVLSSKGYELILVARREDRLKELQNDLHTNSEIICMDVSIADNCKKLYEMVKDKNVDIIINNAGFGVFGKNENIDLDKEINMIDVNIKAMSILTKLFLRDFKERNSGYILNVASSAAFIPGPLMATYYATKAYVLNLTEAIYQELKHDKSNVSISALCPGPVDTEFNKVANVSFGLKSQTSDYVARYAIKNMFKGKMIIIPGLRIKLGIFGTRFISRKALLKIAYNFQTKKQ